MVRRFLICLFWFGLVFLNFVFYTKKKKKTPPENDCYMQDVLPFVVLGGSQMMFPTLADSGCVYCMFCPFYFQILMPLWPFLFENLLSPTMQ